MIFRPELAEAVISGRKLSGSRQARDLRGALAWIAGEAHSDQLEWVSPVIAAFMRTWNDALDDEQRQALKPYIERVIGTAGDGHDVERTWMAADWLVRVCIPAWLDLAGIKDSAKALRSLPPVITEATFNEWQPAVKEAREKAAAAEAAARAAGGAGDAAWAAAAWATAWDAARDAAVEAKEQGGNHSAQYNAAYRAAKAKLDSEPIKQRFEPVKVELQRSAHELLDRMIDGPFGAENA